MKLLLTPILILLGAAEALAGSATWNLSPASGDWNTASNWTPETVPNSKTDIATFGQSNVTNVSISESVIEIGSLIYTPEAGAYTTDISEFTEIGQGGVVNNSPATQTFELGACLSFLYSANAGTNVVYLGEAQAEPCNLNGEITFGDSSNGGNATFILNGNTADFPAFASMAFVGNSTAGNSTIILQSGATKAASLQFLRHASAGKSKIIIEPGGMVTFTDNSTAALSSIFVGRTSSLRFGGAATGALCRVVLSPGGRVHSLPFAMVIGSLEGDGGLVQSSPGLTVGGNGYSTTYSGLIKGRGYLIKRGNESLTLTGANTYSGGTGVFGGTLLVDNTSGSATGTGAITVIFGSTFGGRGNITGPVTIGAAPGGPSAYLAPGIDGPGILTINNPLTFQGNGVYQCDLNLDEAEADEVTATSVTITSGAQFSLQPSGTQILSTGTVFTVISNAGSSAISGTFANLPDGGTITAGPNTLQANYEGGDGNDLTLTVVP